MQKIFVDTVAWIALINLSDTLHSRARQIMGDLRLQKSMLLTTEFVFLEVADALSAPDIRMKTVAFLNGLQKLAILEIEPSNSALFAQGWDLYSQRPDKEWSLTDCISFAVMKQEQTTHAFTSDHHFEQAGFVTLI